MIKKFPQIAKVIKAIGSGIKGFFVGIWNVFKGIGSWIENNFIKYLDWVIDKLNSMTRWIKTVTNFMKMKMGIDKQVAEKKSSSKMNKTIEEIDKKVITEEKDIFERKEVTNKDAAGVGSQPFARSQQPTIEFINFKSMNELQVTIESGFQQLINVNTEILHNLNGNETSIDTPQIPSPQTESENALEPPSVTINVYPTPDMDTDELVRKLKEDLFKETSLNQFGDIG